MCWWSESMRQLKSPFSNVYRWRSIQWWKIWSGRNHTFQRFPRLAQLSSQQISCFETKKGTNDERCENLKFRSWELKVDGKTIENREEMKSFELWIIVCVFWKLRNKDENSWRSVVKSKVKNQRIGRNHWWNGSYFFGERFAL